MGVERVVLGIMFMASQHEVGCLFNAGSEGLTCHGLKPVVGVME
jgi:hypothetical protein